MAILIRVSWHARAHIHIRCTPRSETECTFVQQCTFAHRPNFYWRSSITTSPSSTVFLIPDPAPLSNPQWKLSKLVSGHHTSILANMASWNTLIPSHHIAVKTHAVSAYCMQGRRLSVGEIKGRWQVLDIRCYNRVGRKGREIRREVLTEVACTKEQIIGVDDESYRSRGRSRVTCENIGEETWSWLGLEGNAGLKRAKAMVGNVMFREQGRMSAFLKQWSIPHSGTQG